MIPSKAIGCLLALACAAVALPALAATRTVAPERLPNYWVLTNTSVEADVPNTGLNMTKPGCVAVSYTIGSDGVTRDVRVRKVVPASGLGPVASSIIRNFRYAPVAGNSASVPVSTYYIVQFNMPDDPAAREPLIRACDLSGYGDAAP